MAYVCPKCHCGCMFEERGKLVCLNCGEASSKAAAEGVQHTHTYQTYRGSDPEKPRTVPHRPQTADSEDRGSTRQSKSSLAIVIVLISALVTIFSFVTQLRDTGSEEVTDYGSARVVWGIEGKKEKVPEELIDRMDEFVSAYASGEGKVDLLTLTNDLEKEIGMGNWDGTFNFSYQGDTAVITFRPD